MAPPDRSVDLDAASRRRSAHREELNLFRGASIRGTLVAIPLLVHCLLAGGATWIGMLAERGAMPRRVGVCAYGRGPGTTRRPGRVRAGLFVHALAEQIAGLHSVHARSGMRRLSGIREMTVCAGAHCVSLFAVEIHVEPLSLFVRGDSQADGVLQQHE